MTIRVLVADDQSMVRAGFRMLLSGEEDIEVVAEASNGLEAVDKAARFDPTVVLMDIRMPELDGLEATRRILAADDDARVLILTTFDLDEYVYAGLHAGAAGFLLKDSLDDELLQAVRAVASGHNVAAPTVTRRLVQHFVATATRNTDTTPLTRLTNRERDVLKLIAEGLSNQEIAGRLTISEGTVKTHVSRILAKLGLRDRIQAAIYAYQSGMT
jgi:DNA-binding NarL/FixJ family response regulator